MFQTLVFRNVCRLHLKQLKTSCQSWRQLSASSNQFALLGMNKHRCYCTKSEDNKEKEKAEPADDGGLGQGPFISPIRKPANPNIMQKLRAKKKKEDAQYARGPHAAIIATTALGFVFMYFYVKDKLKKYELDALKDSMQSVQEEVLIGGEWELTNHNEKKMTNEDFEGKWCIIYFGFTHCPDVCPDELEKIVEVMDILDRNPRLPKLRALFVTVDPERDSPAALKTYLSEFSDKIVGLTGNWDELKKILKAFKVYYSRGPIDEDGDYIVDHSIITYLMNPSGKYEAHFPRSKTNIDISNVIERKMNTWVPK